MESEPIKSKPMDSKIHDAADARSNYSFRGSDQYSDPTYNVLQLVDAAVKRLDDLRATDSDKLYKINELNKEIINLHMNYWREIRASDEKLSLAESKRIDAIRAVDVAAVAIASEKQTAQATVLATQLSASAETLRNLVDQRATAVAVQSQQSFAQLSERIASLEKSASEGVGKGRVTDPMMGELIAEVRSLSSTRSTVKGSNMGMTAVIGYIIAAISTAVLIYNATQK